ncbi:uncharacterized protein LOC110027394 [Phalaenopsis equestris]|uniref:uncharacterized protein LOC110027394 n=1 Tax=Phalaenopsis equestris TaxID=78828 RepID=UPI0009E5F4C4|nr:uncharacterized protein LOC110027394 [Phalaenopsis equestris]XP_020584456.1 uncharacterized protein LOC110027394 [Phalaenopsis equestris]XP_020584457.1 uncharacterized protein LOC110027394 [Phalaenopsis equestris]
MDWDAAPPNPSDEWYPRPDCCSDDDGGDSLPASSKFSSCDGSDFDRYCSANSVLGSASTCSSIGNYYVVGEEFPLEGHNSRKKFQRSRWNEFEYFSDGGAETPRANGSYESLMARMSTGSSLIHDYTESSSSCHGVWGEDNNLRLPCLAKGKELPAFSSVICSSLGANGNGDSDEKEEECALNEILLIRQNETHLDLKFGGLINIEGNEDAFPQSKLSESDDSMLDYGTDNEGRIRFCKRSFKLAEKSNHEDVNPLIMSSSVAFGSNDWNEFVQDTEGGGLASLSLHLDQSFQRQDNHIEREIEKKVEDIPTASFEVENLTVKDVGDDNYVSAINHETQVNDTHTQIGGGRFSVINNHEVEAVDPTSRNSEYASASALQNTLSKGNGVKCYLNSPFDTAEIQSTLGEDSGIYEASEKKINGGSELSLANNGAPLQFYSRLNGTGEKINGAEPGKNNGIMPLSDHSRIQRFQGKDPSYSHLAEVNIQESEVKKFDASDSYDEMVLEMEEILLDSRNSHGSMYLQTNQGYVSQQPRHFGDGSSFVSTAAMDYINPPVQVSSKIDRVELVGAKQQKGDVSLGERLIGVREYTIYQMKVWSGTDEWNVERRYRDFVALYRQLKTLFIGHGLSLPSAWSRVEQDSRKFFGNASPNVVLERSILIEDCLRSTLNSRFPFGTPSPLIMFLTPGKAMFKSGLFQSLVPQYLQKFAEDENPDCGEPHPEDASLLGKTISLVVEIKPQKSLRQLLEIQHYTCAGCHRHLDIGKTLFRELVQTFGWNRPRFCEYTGQLFCASCHTNDTSVLPARVLHLWDFTLHPVSQLAKAYLESIYDQPMLCVSAVNPFLFSKVPALLHVMVFRKKIGAMLPSVNCPFRSSIQKSLGFRRYLLESNDFFALRDLVDLSKGPFAALPIMVENISNLILEHITQQCLVCYDSGVPCAARQACYDPSSLIFPFQEAEAEKCNSCGSIFHKACFIDLLGCPCSNHSAISKRYSPTESITRESQREPVGFSERSIQPVLSNSTTGFFSNLLTRIKSDKLWKPKNSSTVILMGSLPSSSL